MGLLPVTVPFSGPEIRDEWRDFGTGVRAFVPGRFGSDARDEVSSEFDAFRQRGGLGRDAFTFLGPPESDLEANITAPLLVLPAGKFLGKGGGKAAAKGAPIVGKASFITKLFAKPTVRKTAAIGGGTAAAGAGIALFGDDVGRGAGGFFEESLGGIGDGVGSAFSGVGEGLKDALVPIAVIGVGILALQFIDKGK